MTDEAPLAEASMMLAVEHQDTAAIVTIGGELEFGTAAALRSALVDVARQGCALVVVDLAGLQFIDSTGLSLLVQAQQRIESQGQRFVLRNPTDRVRRVLEISGLAQLFTIE